MTPEEIEIVINAERTRFDKVIETLFENIGETLTVAILSEHLESRLAELIAKRNSGIAERYSDSVH